MRDTLSQSVKTKLAKVAEAQRAGEFVARCQRFGIPTPELEYRFAPPRKWQVDFCWPTHRIALECEGGAWTQGRHTRGSGYIADQEKYNALAMAGYRLFRTTPGQLTELPTLRMMGQALGVTVPKIGEIR